MADIEKQRRAEDISLPLRSINCDQHEFKIDEINQIIHTSRGWARAAAGFWGIATLIIGFLGSDISSKLNNIQEMLSNDKSDIRILNEQVKHLQSDMKIIQDRHTFQDQERLKRGR